jgi:phage shock protein E
MSRTFPSAAAFAIGAGATSRALFALLALAAVAAHAGDAPDMISPEDLAARLRAKQSLTVIDVRTPEEFATVHVPGALNIPYDHIAERIGELDQARGGPVVVYCRTGRRSGIAQQTLRSKGFANVLHLDGDLPGWQAHGYAVEPAQEKPPEPSQAPAAPR